MFHIFTKDYKKLYEETRTELLGAHAELRRAHVEIGRRIRESPDNCAQDTDSMCMVKSDPTLEERLSHVEGAISSLYIHFNLSRVLVTEKVLDGINSLVTETRAEMRKIAKARE